MCYNICKIDFDSILCYQLYLRNYFQLFITHHKNELKM